MATAAEDPSAWCSEGGSQGAHTCKHRRLTCRSRSFLENSCKSVKFPEKKTREEKRSHVRLYLCVRTHVIAFRLLPSK